MASTTTAPPESSGLGFLDKLDRIDPRIIYLLVALSLSLPLVLNISLRPASMNTANAFFTAVEDLKPQPGKIVVIAMDWGPGTSAENEPQTKLAMEHLMRKRIPFAVVTIYTLGVPFLEQTPLEVAKRLETEMPDEHWEYGKDWVNWGYVPGGSLGIQSLAKAEDLAAYLKTDANAIPIADLPAMQGVHNLKDIVMFMQFTGLVGTFSSWLQFFQGPVFLHGCTSVTIPEAFIYYSSKQIQGFFEGLAGAAWYEVRLQEKYTNRDKEGVALRTNTGLSFAQLIVLAFILAGNLGLLRKNFTQQKREK